MPTMKRYKAECDLAGVSMHFRADGEEEAWKFLLSHPEYRRASRKFKASKSDWILKEE